MPFDAMPQTDDLLPPRRRRGAEGLARAGAVMIVLGAALCLGGGLSLLLGPLLEG